jgi:hypothetical protein
VTWEVAYGDRLPLLEKMAEKGVMPEALANRPEVSAHAASYYNAFVRLHSSRLSAGMPIPLTAVEAYARMFAFDDLDERAELLRYVGACDRAFLAESGKNQDDVPGKHTEGWGR